ncbi:MAG: hypothetical protein ABW321_27690 [Polyangiales bacterium]
MIRGVPVESDLIARCRAEEDTLAEVRCVLRNQLLRSGLADIEVPQQLQSCRLITDPNDGSTTLVGEWRKQRGKVIGSVVIHENGELFAELGVLQPAPDNPRMRVDRVVAFGAAGALQAELRMTPTRE